MLHAGIDLRKKLGSKALESAFRGLSNVSVRTPMARRAIADVRVIRDVPYSHSGHPDHTLDVYIPAGASDTPRPVVFYVHGGGFRILSKETHWFMGVAFARQGFITVNINYRLAPTHPYPSAINDVFDAWEWTLENIHRYGGDPTRIVVAGESAGANLVTALSVATCEEHESEKARHVFRLGKAPDVLLANSGMLQVTDADRFLRRKPLPSWLFDRIEEVSVDYLGDEIDPWLADPLVAIEKLESFTRTFPATFASSGTKDPILDDTRRLEAALKPHGVEPTVHYYPGEVHAFHVFLWRKQAIQCWEDQYAFLRAQGFALANR